MNASVKVYDILGNTILKKEIDHSRNDLDFSMLINGLYLIKILGHDNTLLYSGKIIKK